MIPVRFPFWMLALSLAALPALAQTATTPSAAATKSPATGTSVDVAAAEKEVEKLYLNGSYDDVIAKATKALDDLKKDDPRLRYFRGRAALALGFYGLARRDFSAVGDFKPYEKWKPAPEYVALIDELKGLAPTKTFEIRDDEGAVVFRVYYDRENAWSKAIVDLLPAAYRINRELLGRDLRETPVFIFANPIRFQNFLTAHDGKEPGAWAWAFGGIGGFYFCQNKLGGAEDFKSPWFRGTVVHEFNHCLVSRISGNALMPSWFKEGLAMTTEPAIDSQRATQFEYDFQAIIKADELVSMKIMSDPALFQKQVEARDTVKCDPYAQAWSMTSFFLTLVAPEKLTPFLEAVRDSRNFDQTLQKFTGLTPDEFFEKWRLQARH